MNSSYAYFYTNLKKTVDVTTDMLFQGEYIIYKEEEIKAEDSESNCERNMKLYITNFRVLVVNPSRVFDIPLPRIKSHYVKTPILYGSSYICIYIDRDYKISPFYIKEQLNIITSSFKYPEYIMIKFKSKQNSINKANDIIKHSISSKDYERSVIKKENTNTNNNINNNSTTNTGTNNVSSSNNNFTNNNSGNNSQINNQGDQVKIISSTLGIQGAVKYIDNRNQQNQNLITNSFSGINSLRQNASCLIEIGSQLKSKLVNSNEKEASEINQMLQKIGYIDPVTKEQTGKEYYKELAFQIQKYFEEYFKTNEGIITLIDAYCIYNRARGMSKLI